MTKSKSALFFKKSRNDDNNIKVDKDFPLMWSQLSMEFLARLQIRKINRDSTFNDFEIIKVLGEGGFGKVILCQEKSTKIYLAMKLMSKSYIVKHKQVHVALNEKDILSMCKFKFIIKVLTAFQTNDFLCLCIELAPGGDLYDLLKDNSPLSPSVTRFYTSQIVLGLQYLHTMQIVYRDLKPENILFSKNGYLKLADMGFAKILMNKPRTYTFCGTPEYIAPEIILNKGYGCAVDWWSFGILLYKLLIGKTPFQLTDEIQMFQNISKGAYKIPHSLVEDAKRLIVCLLQVDISRRYGNLRNGALDVRYHNFYNTINWIAIYEQTIFPPFPVKTLDLTDLKREDIMDTIKDTSETNQYEKEFNFY